MHDHRRVTPWVTAGHSRVMLEVTSRVMLEVTAGFKTHSTLQTSITADIPNTFIPYPAYCSISPSPHTSLALIRDCEPHELCDAKIGLNIFVIIIAKDGLPGTNQTKNSFRITPNYILAGNCITCGKLYHL